MKMDTKHVTDMTVGSPVHHILIFALPLLFGNLFQQLYNMVDSIIVGNYVGADAFAAVGSCGSISFLFFSLSSGLSVGIGVIVSQFFGAKEEDKVNATIANSIYVLGVAAILVSLVGIIFAPAILQLLRTPAEILGDAVIYMRTTCAGTIAIVAYNGVASILRALGDSKTPLYFLIISSLINVGLDLLFVLVFHMGVVGVAVATIIAQAVSAITCVIYAYKKVPYFRLTKEQMKPRRQLIYRTIRLGVPIALQNSMIAVSCMALQGVVNSYGKTVMAAYTVTNRVEQIIQQPFGSLSVALTTYAGQNYGSRNIERVKKGFHQATIMAFVFSMVMLPLFFFFSEQIVHIFVKEPEVIRIGAKALQFTSVFYFALGMIYVPRAVLNGCGDAMFAMLNGVTEVSCRIGFSQVFTRVPKLGWWSIWVTTIATWVITSMVCSWRYLYVTKRMKNSVN